MIDASAGLRVELGVVKWEMGDGERVMRVCLGRN